MTTVAEALINRKSVRAFLDKPVSEADIKNILTYARQAPSGTNTQPWQVAVVSGASKAKLDDILVSAFKNGDPKVLDYNYYPLKMPAEFQRRRLACGMQMFQTLGITRENKERRLEQWALNYSAFGAPVAMYFFTNKLVEKGSFMDCGMFLQSVMLMATELGLATCAQAALAEYPHLVKEFLGYPEDSILLCGMALGYEDKDAPINSYRTVREDLDVFTKFYS